MTYNFKYSDRTLQYIIGSLYKHNDISYWYCIAPQLAFYPEMLWAHSSETFEANTQSSYLSKISDETLYAYNVYQIEGEGRHLFSSINGDENTIMGLPIKKIKEYLEGIK